MEPLKLVSISFEFGFGNFELPNFFPSIFFLIVTFEALSFFSKVFNECPTKAMLSFLLLAELEDALQVFSGDLDQKANQHQGWFSWEANRQPALSVA